MFTLFLPFLHRLQPARFRLHAVGVIFAPNENCGGNMYLEMAVVLLHASVCFSVILWTRPDGIWLYCYPGYPLELILDLSNNDEQLDRRQLPRVKAIVRDLRLLLHRAFLKRFNVFERNGEHKMVPAGKEHLIDDNAMLS